jgi:hypothetical protein
MNNKKDIIIASTVLCFFNSVLLLRLALDLWIQAILLQLPEQLGLPANAHLATNIFLNNITNNFNNFYILLKWENYKKKKTNWAQEEMENLNSSTVINEIKSILKSIITKYLQAG